MNPTRTAAESASNEPNWQCRPLKPKRMGWRVGRGQNFAGWNRYSKNNAKI